MKFIYEYRTSDNVRHTGIIKASTKEEAYATLKSGGIRPGSVVEAPGFFNKLFGKGKRWVAIVVLSVVASVASYIAVVDRGQYQIEAIPRTQIYGDPVVLQSYENSDWKDVSSDDGDVFLARFAIPGKYVACDKIATVKVNTNPLVIEDSDPDELRKMKRIINGMKEELSAYLNDGGTVESYIERLKERQDLEVKLCQKLYDELEILKRQMASVRGDRRIGSSEIRNARKQFMQSWIEKNKFIREMGFRSRPIPDEWEQDENEEK